MALENKLDVFAFLTLRGEVVFPRQMIELDQRNGVDGTEATLLGTKGSPFQLMSQVDQASFSYASFEAKQYHDLIEDGAVDLIKDGIDYSIYGLKFQVLNVTIVKCQRITTAVGGINPPSLAWLEAVWELIAIVDEPEPPPEEEEP